MIQSITFGDKNTWDDWKLIAVERPVFSPPKQKTTFIDIPGGNGSLDLSEALTKYPVYENRTGSFTFRVMNDYGKWCERYSEIMNYLHGRVMNAVLADDEEWFYRGRFSIDDWKSEDTWSQITIGYNVDPYKWSVDSVSKWLWDPFNFDDGVMKDGMFSNIEINSSDTWLHKTYAADNFGNAPISPTVAVSGTDGTEANGIQIRFVNEYLGIDTKSTFIEGEHEAPDMIFYGQTTDYSIYFKGVGTVTLDFKVGRL